MFLSLCSWIEETTRGYFKGSFDFLERNWHLTIFIRSFQNCVFSLSLFICQKLYKTLMEKIGLLYHLLSSFHLKFSQVGLYFVNKKFNSHLKFYKLGLMLHNLALLESKALPKMLQGVKLQNVGFQEKVIFLDLKRRKRFC